MQKRPTGKKTLFISHVSTESEFAQYLKRRFEKDFLGSLNVFVSSDQTTIAAGTRWLDEVEKALKDADLQVLLCSKESVGRPWVNFEAGAVWLTGVPVIPVCHSGMTPNDLPVPLSMLQAIKMSDSNDLPKLYSAIAHVVGLQMPEIDFGALAEEVKVLEKQYARAREAVERIEEPRILCAASEQYAEPVYGFERDVAVLERAFPGRVLVEDRLTRRRLGDLLTNQQFDIVHLVLPVDEETGDMFFGRVDPATLKPATPTETLPPKGFADLLVESRTRLVVLATCDAMLLAVEVAPTANMAFSNTTIHADAAVEWEEWFYGFLAAGKSVYKAWDLTKSQTNAPMRHIRSRDVVFGRMKVPA
jgi:TIR domain